MGIMCGKGGRVIFGSVATEQCLDVFRSLPLGFRYDAQKYDFEQYDSPTNLNENLDTESAEGGNSTTAGSKGKFRRHRLYVPLAVRYELAAFHGVVPPRRRRFLANFVGSTGTHESRLDMKAAIQRWDATLPPARADAVCMWHFADDWVGCSLALFLKTISGRSLR